MSIDSVLDNGSRIQYVASAAQTDFDYPFAIFAEGDIIVDVDGVVQALTTDYTVTGVEDDNGGTVSLVVALAGGEIVTLYRDTAIERTSDFLANGPNASSAMNDELDRIIVIAQELETRIGRALRIPFSANVDASELELDPTTYASKVLTFDADGKPEPGVLSATTMSQSIIAGLLFPRTTAEIAAGITPVDYSVMSHDKCGYFMPERYALNTTPGTTVMQTGVERAITVAVQAGGGTVLLSDRYKMSGPLAGAASVDIFGMGQGAALEFPAGHGITIGWLTGFGSVTYDNFQVIGSGAGDYYGIYQAGTLDDDDELYGLTLRNLLITDWNVGIKLRTVRVVTLDSNWIQGVDRGVELIGKCLVVHLDNNKVVHAAGGGGSGASIGMTFNSFDYTNGTGVVPNEGVQWKTNYVYGFDTAINIGFVNVFNLLGGDIQASVYGIDFTTIQYEFSVRGVHFDLAGNNVIGVYGRGLASVLPAAAPLFDGCSFSASGTGTIGIKINDSGNQNQSFVTVHDCLFHGFTLYDILFNNANGGWILNNRCMSSGTTYSINITQAIGVPVYVDKNLCANAINWQAADAAAGLVQLGHNTINGSTQLYGSNEVPTVASATAVTLPANARVVKISGTTNITSIVATGWAGREVTLIFEGILNLTDGSNLKLASTFTSSADDAIRLVCDGTNWYTAGGPSVN